VDLTRIVDLLYGWDDHLAQEETLRWLFANCSIGAIPPPDNFDQ